MDGFQTEIEGLDYTVEGLSKRFLDPHPVDVYVQDDRPVTASPVNGGSYTLHSFTEDMEKGIVRDNTGLLWIYDVENDVTAYFDGEDYVAAYNPDIGAVWDDLVEAVDSEEEDEVEMSDPFQGLNRLHPATRKDILRDIESEKPGSTRSVFSK